MRKVHRRKLGQLGMDTCMEVGGGWAPPQTFTLGINVGGLLNAFKHLNEDWMFVFIIYYIFYYFYYIYVFIIYLLMRGSKLGVRHVASVSSPGETPPIHGYNVISIISQHAPSDVVPAPGRASGRSRPRNQWRTSGRITQTWRTRRRSSALFCVRTHASWGATRPSHILI